MKKPGNRLWTGWLAGGKKFALVLTHDVDTAGRPGEMFWI